MNEEFWKNKRVLVTGHKGFLGRHVCRTLKKLDAYTIGVDLPECDLTDHAQAKLVFDSMPHVVLHLAGMPGVKDCEENPKRAFEANVVATHNVLDWLNPEYLQAAVFVSSNHVYGEQEKKPTTEDAPLNGKGIYAATKIAADVLARAWGKSTGLPIGVARITNTYGPDDHHTEHLVTGTILSLLRGEEASVRGNINDTKGYLYVVDTVNGILAVAKGLATGKAKPGEAFNIVPNKPSSVLRVLVAIRFALGLSEGRTAHVANAKATEHEHLCNYKAAERLGWAAIFSLDGGVQLTADWYRANQLEHASG